MKNYKIKLIIILNILILAVLSAQDFEVEIPILIQCTASEEHFEGIIRIEEELSKWTLKNKGRYGDTFFNRSIFELTSNKRIQISFKNSTYENNQPIFQMRAAPKSTTISKNPTLSEFENNTYFAFYVDYATLSLINHKTGFEIKISSKYIQNLHEGFIYFMHYGVETKCPYRLTELDLNSDTIPSLLKQKIE